MARSTRKSKVAPASAKLRIVKVTYREYSEIENDLNTVQCALACASVALGQAQDGLNVELGAKAWKVIHTCVGKLNRLNDDLDSWHVSHEHSPKGVRHV